MFSVSVFLNFYSFLFAAPPNSSNRKIHAKPLNILCMTQIAEGINGHFTLAARLPCGVALPTVQRRGSAAVKAPDGPRDTW